MKVLLLNQFFPPDLAPTGQLAAELAEDLVATGAQVTALTSRGTYLGGERLPARERWRGIEVVRVAATSMGKRTLLHRAIDYASFYAAAAAAIVRLPRHDVVVSLTTPPLISAAAQAARALRGSRHVHWVQDLYPEVAVAFGALRQGAPTTRAMAALSRAVLRRCDAVVALGEAMRRRCIQAGAPPDRTLVVPNWLDDQAVRPVEHADNPLRAGLAGVASVLVMYSGNMGRAHDVATLIGAAERLAERTDLAFVFVGEGAKRQELERAAARLPNLRLAPYAPREQLAQSLSAGDVHLLSMSPEVLGLLEPSKLYGVMAAGRPAVFVGPAEAEVARTIEAERCGLVIQNGDEAGLAAALAGLADRPSERLALGLRGREALLARYSRKVATARLVRILEAVALDLPLAGI